VTKSTVRLEFRAHAVFIMLRNQLLTRLSHWLGKQLIDEVPTDLVICEYECRRGRCTEGEFRTCIRRATHPAGQTSQSQIESFQIIRESALPREEQEADASGAHAWR